MQHLNDKLDALRKDIANLHEHFDSRFDALPCKTSCPRAERRKTRSAYVAAIAIPLATSLAWYVSAKLSPAPASAQSR